MATSSIFESIQIKSDAEARSLLDAMEEAEEAAKTRVRRPVRFKELKTDEEIEEFFGK